MKTKGSKIIFFVFFFCLICLSACKESPLPKPKSYLRLEYPNTSYKILPKGYPFSFEYSNQALIIKKDNNFIDIKYPKLKATIVMTYSPVKNNLILLLKDAEKLTFKHVRKADNIQSVFFEDFEKKVYGKVFEISGNAATQIQFHATDSIQNFITGALYFYAKPNYDSIIPAVNYIKTDILHLMETLKWKKSF